MATLVLSAAGMALGSSLGGTVLGVGMATIGRAAGATLGSLIDQRILGAGGEAVETGKIGRFRLTGASEGAAIARIYGRMRLSGQVIWASEFVEKKFTNGGGKGAPSQPSTTQYSYSVSLAIGLCEGVISRMGRIWADGVELAPNSLNLRIYRGTQDQQPDPRIEAIEGEGRVPAYRGLAYVVIEDLDLAQFGNRVPQFSFEVMRPSQSDEPIHQDLAQLVRGVALMPGTGEYALATTPVTINKGFGENVAANVNTPSGLTDFSTSVQALDEELPQCESVSLVVSWFGNDLRCGQCTLQPKIDQAEGDAAQMPWQVSGISREAAARVPLQDGRAVYGGTPTDSAVMQALKHLNDQGKKAVFYPFILMDQLPGNTLMNPWSGAPGQPPLPWRGRITSALAPGVDGSPDQSAAAEAEVAAFFGAASPSDFAPHADGVSYHGPQEWSYRRFILHYAHLCAQAGGVDAFCIGSEMRSLTQIRGANGFPAVAALVALARDVRTILGPDVKIGYAADWSEYHGYQPVGTDDKYFHLDPLWADEAIDFIGIDNYMPLSDWREGHAHRDAQEHAAIYDIDYLMGNIEGGEGYDWYYHSPEAAAAQIRTPITDGEGEPWIWRYKDLPNWWLNAHHERIGGIRAASPTAWEPGSKPIWFTEIGCAAIDKGTNEPNRFFDPKSSESGLPRASNAVRDDFIQMQYIRAISQYYNDPARNPVSPTTGVQMVEPERIHVWAWDARPFPAFPGRGDLWSDHENYGRGHWLNGRAASRSLASVVAEICEEAGVTDYDVSALYGVVRGYGVEDVRSARAVLQPLMLAHGFDAIERDGRLIFKTRGARLTTELQKGDLVYNYDQDGAIELRRSPQAELSGRVRLSYIDGSADYESRAAEAVFPDDSSAVVSSSELAMVLTDGEARRISERWLAEARVARDSASFALPPSLFHLGAGDVVRLPDGHGDGLYRLDQVEIGGFQSLEAVRIETAIYEPQNVPESAAVLAPFVTPVPVELMFLDLPLLRGDEDPIAPHVAASAAPWPGQIALFSATQDAGYRLNHVIGAPAVIGQLLTPLAPAPLGRIDRGPACRVRLIRGDLQSVSMDQMLAGANLAAIGDGSAERWEVFQFSQASLVAPNTYDLRLRLRGQGGSDGASSMDWPAGSVFVLLDQVPQQIALAPAARGVAQYFRYGPGNVGYDHSAYQSRVETFRGAGLRPYPVCHLRAHQTSEGLALNWIRRSRIGADQWDGLEVPLGEAQERYLLRVYAGGVKRRELVLSGPGFMYSASMATEDGPDATRRFEVSQVSDMVGAGPSRSIIVDV